MNSAKGSAVDRSKDVDATAGRDDLALTWFDLADRSRGSITDALTDRLRQALVEGRLAQGTALPPTRVLAEHLQVSRGVVTTAYSRLADEGWVQGRGRGGTVVRARSGGSAGGTGAAGGAGAAQAGAAGGSRPSSPRALDALSTPTDNAGFDVLRALPARIDLTPGRPDLSTFPRAAWLRAEREVLRDASHEALGYGDPQGSVRLREAVARWLARYRALVVDASEIVIVAGVAQAMVLLAKLWNDEAAADPAIEDPGSLGVRQQLAAWGVRTVPVPVDDQGLDVAALDATRARSVVVTPAHQFPTGVVLSGPRRQALLEWAATRDGLVIEDDYDAEHRYDRQPVPALAGGDRRHVCYVGSTSKVLAPAIRTGWMVPPAHLRDALIAAKRESDLGNPTLPQLVLAQLLDRGDLERHLRSARGRHRERRDALLRGLDEGRAAMGGGLEVLGIAAGLHLTVRLPDGVDDVAVAVALAERHGIKCQPLAWHRQLPGFPGLVLGYATTSPGLLVEAGRAVVQVVDEMASRSRTAHR